MGLSINAEKSHFLLHSRKRDRTGFYSSSLFGKTLPVPDQVKYLGVIIDSTIRWKAHVEARVSKVTKCYWGLKKAVGNNWGLAPCVISWFYTAIIRPLFAHGSIV